jgi:ribosome modulation factor
MPPGNRNPQPVQIRRCAAAGIAPRDHDTTPHQQVRQRAHAGASGANEVHRTGIGWIEE